MKRGPFGGDLKKAFFVDDGYKVYEQQHAIKNNFSLGHYFINEERFERLKACKVEPGDFIVSCSGTMGRIARLPKNAPIGVINQALMRITINEEIVDSSFFIHFFKSNFFQVNILQDSRGTGMQNMASIKEIKAIEFLLPPLPLQRAIVTKIENLFTSLDKGIEDLKKAQEQLKVYRQAVLKKAFEGEWQFIKLEEVSEAVGGYAFKSKTFLEEGKFQIIRIGNVRPGVIRNDASPVFVNEVEKKVESRYRLQIGDVVISLTGTRTKRDYGFTAIINQDNLLLNQRLAYIRFYDEYLPKFFLYFSWSEPFKNQFFGSETGNTGQGNVGMKSVKETLIPFPSIEEQKQIIKEIESRLSVCDKLEQNINEGLEKAEALRQSILKKAFEGKLLSEAEIERCKQEADYEPASVLLERIKKENSS